MSVPGIGRQQLVISIQTVSALSLSLSLSVSLFTVGDEFNEWVCNRQGNFFIVIYVTFI
jgi:hypothetical protein